MDNALLISDERKWIFSDIDIIGPDRKLAQTGLILSAVISGKEGYLWPDLARQDHDNKNSDYNSDRNIL